MNLIHIIMTGGTIDSEWDSAQDMVEVAEHSQIPAYFASKKTDNLQFSEVCMKDSRALTEADFKDILKTVEESKASKIIITHGTFAMIDTARFLEDNLKRTDQIIILTGAKTPIGFANSDAPANLDTAISKMEKLELGVYLCMNARVFTPEEVAKNIDEGKFYSVFREEQ